MDSGGPPPPLRPSSLSASSSTGTTMGTTTSRKATTKSSPIFQGTLFYGALLTALKEVEEKHGVEISTELHDVISKTFDEVTHETLETMCSTRADLTGDLVTYKSYMETWMLWIRNAVMRLGPGREIVFDDILCLNAVNPEGTHRRGRGRH
eukprot:TRINITY_DN619_c0_g2_i1.p1 TRINITY_DN619_c0_g2~~TRINITY_DN619_c0_g2_i1.p1  ORF type:complete len:151 (+),score=41.21 TRINITY_DN619_c0_g2_i1:207-659(+)